jgi:hypothetical protein
MRVVNNVEHFAFTKSSHLTTVTHQEDIMCGRENGGIPSPEGKVYLTNKTSEKKKGRGNRAEQNNRTMEPQNIFKHA